MFKSIALNSITCKLNKEVSTLNSEFGQLMLVKFMTLTVVTMSGCEYKCDTLECS